MYEDNSQSERKRQRSDSQSEDRESEKLSKLESATKSFVASAENPNSYNYSSSQGPSQPEPLLDIRQEFYESNIKTNLFDLIWKIEIPKEKFSENFRICQKRLNKENEEYLFSVSHIPYEGSSSSSLIILFQNGQGLSENEFIEELFNLEKSYILESKRTEFEALKKQQNAYQTSEEAENNPESPEEVRLREELSQNIVLRGKYHQSEENTLDKDDEDNTSNVSEERKSQSCDMMFSINIVNFKNSIKSFKNVTTGEIIKLEIPLNTIFHTYTTREDVSIVVDFSVRKNYALTEIYTGIVNEAMTCYMNSMLQTLNVLGYFKNAVFQIPLDPNEDKDMSVAYSLQKLFYDLLVEKKPISTNRLVKSFGWSRDQIFIQHDIQEFNLQLSDLMEKRMKGTSVEGTFKFLFEGKVLNYIECLDVEYKSNKEESFSDIQLTVKGCNNIYESFNEYTKEEILEGDDKYEAGDLGKQRAKKGIRFLEFPNVMILQLKRFEYNMKKDIMDKINDYFEFYEEIDLKNYVSDTNKNSSDEDYKYTLHSIVIHKGSMNNGHYYAYIRPDTSDNWYHFNDESVRQADKYEVFKSNFGGFNKIYRHKDKGVIAEFNQRTDASAYILVYIKNSLRDQILKPITISEVKIFYNHKIRYRRPSESAWNMTN